MKHRTLASLILLFVAAAALASDLDSRPPAATNSNPIRLEGQIREITDGEGGVTIRLHRDRYPIVAHAATRVRWLDGRRATVSQLQKGDSIRVEGNQERTFISADRVTILLRIERRP